MLPILNQSKIYYTKKDEFEHNDDAQNADDADDADDAENAQNAQNAQNADDAQNARETDFWELIAQLEWKDKDDGHNVHWNKCWTVAQYQIVMQNIDRYANALDRVLANDDFWRAYPDKHYDTKKNLQYHIIARGKTIYDTVMDDPQFMHGFIDQESGFREMLFRPK